VRTRRRAPRSPVFDAVEASFQRLLADPQPLGVRTSLGVLPLAVVRPLLIDQTTPARTVDAVWVTLIGRARSGQAVWLLAAVGCALPRLRRAIWHATRTRCVDKDEAAAAALAAFTEALLSVDPVPRRQVLAELIRPAHNAAQQVADRVKRDRTRQCRLSASIQPPAPGGHPDFVLADLVRDGVIDQAEAELIGRHRLEGVSLRRLAAERGTYPMRLCRLLKAAETRVVTALTQSA
jgi:hypothetical protein